MVRIMTGPIQGFAAVFAFFIFFGVGLSFLSFFSPYDFRG